ncbi:hypothetical protein [Pelagibacterium xiamenense]|uniref:hypothetical protein n=1 Tax=Pelagibacterium xiamenense TaxID=2901140 RepID=UPI001E2C0D50|nr:hypothetical protein [Pelagibacterium xiamenense]MCD7061336.1 hypothetical protein [Pelagibacterium xiamenense]
MRNGDSEKRIISAHNLPIAIERPAPRPSLVRISTQSAFAAQLIATRDGMPVQRARRRASDGEANSAYRLTDTLDVKRVPAGYRKTLSA